MDNLEYGKSTTIGGLYFEYLFWDGRHSWVHARNGKEVYGFFDRGDGTYILTDISDGESYLCTTLSDISKRVAYWEVCAGNTEPFFCPSQQANTSS